MDQGWCGRCWNCWVVLRPIRNSNADKINMSAASDLRHTVNKHKLKIQLITKGNGQKWYSMEWDHILEMCNRWQWMACHPLLQALGAASIWEEWSSQSKSFPYHWRWQTLPNIYKKHFPRIQYFFFFFPLNLYRLHLAALRVKMESFNAKSLPVQGDFEAEVRMDGCWELTLLRNSSGETSDKPDAPKITIQ